jgi:hypothetical protein
MCQLSAFLFVMFGLKMGKGACFNVDKKKGRWAGKLDMQGKEGYLRVLRTVTGENLARRPHNPGEAASWQWALCQTLRGQHIEKTCLCQARCQTALLTTYKSLSWFACSTHLHFFSRSRRGHRESRADNISTPSKDTDHQCCSQSGDHHAEDAEQAACSDEGAFCVACVVMLS